jgi:sugar/nucleoside kinase (ribokinase family)
MALFLCSSCSYLQTNLCSLQVVGRDAKEVRDRLAQEHGIMVIMSVGVRGAKQLIITQAGQDCVYISFMRCA